MLTFPLPSLEILGFVCCAEFQVIYPADLPTKGVFACESSFDDAPPLKRPFSAFGWSMASKSDVDGNMPPDLVVGDYESEQVSVNFYPKSFEQSTDD